MLHYVQHDTIAVKKAIWVNIYIIANNKNARLSEVERELAITKEVVTHAMIGR